MKKSLFFAVFILCAAGAGAQTHQFLSANIKKADINMLGGNLNVTAVRGTQYSYVDVQNFRNDDCDIQVTLKADKELVVRVQRFKPNASCSANIKVGIPERAHLAVTAYDTTGEISLFRRSVALDIRQSTFYVRDFMGGVDITSHSSDVYVEGAFREVLINSHDRARTFLEWVKNPQHIDITLSGSGDVYFTLPRLYDVKKIEAALDKSDFTGLLSIKNK